MNGSCSDCDNSFWWILIPRSLSTSLVHAFSAKLNAESVETLDCWSKRSSASSYRLESIYFFMIGDNETFEKHLDFDWTTWQRRRMSIIYKKKIKRNRRKRQIELEKIIDIGMASYSDCVSYEKCSEAKRQVTPLCVHGIHSQDKRYTVQLTRIRKWRHSACIPTRCSMKVSREGASCECAKW
jgi:hypothetical protein